MEKAIKKNTTIFSKNRHGVKWFSNEIKESCRRAMATYILVEEEWPVNKEDKNISYLLAFSHIHKKEKERAHSQFGYLSPWNSNEIWHQGYFFNSGNHTHNVGIVTKIALYFTFRTPQTFFLEVGPNHHLQTSFFFYL